MNISFEGLKRYNIDLISSAIWLMNGRHACVIELGGFVCFYSNNILIYRMIDL